MNYADIAESRREIKPPRGKTTPRPDLWYKRFPDDFYRGTRQLSIAARGAYNDILDQIYLQGGPIPDDNRWIACSLHITPRHWLKLRKELFDAGKLELAPEGGIVNGRAMEEIATKSRPESGQKSTRKAAEKRPKLGPVFRPSLNEINGGRAGARERASEREVEVEKKESPLPPVNGGTHDEGQGRVFWKGALNPSTGVDEVTVQDGKPILAGKTRERWLAKFKTEERLDVALAAIHLRLGSAEPIHRQVERSLARQVGDKLDRDDRYQAAAKANGHARPPEATTEELLAILNGAKP